MLKNHPNGYTYLKSNGNCGAVYLRKKYIIHHSTRNKSARVIFLLIVNRLITFGLYGTPLIREISIYCENDNSVHQCRGHTSGCLLPYFIFINIVFIYLISVFLFEFLNTFYKSQAFTYFYNNYIVTLFCLSDFINCCLNIFVLH